MIPEYSNLDIYIKNTDCGPDDTVFMSVLMGDIQEAAEVGAKDCGFDTYLVNGKNACWIVLRNKIHINRMPKWREKISIRTWSTGINKFYFGREYEIFDSNNEIIAYATSIWILADINTHKPIIPGKNNDFFIPEPQNIRKVFDSEAPKVKATLKPSDRQPDIIKFGDFSEMDHNGHVNNSRYLAWIYDALYKKNYEISKITEININYNMEVKFEEKIEVYILENGTNSVLVYGYKGEKDIVFSSEITFNL